jgi:DNA-binding CsgD family transcriptional regulator
LTWPCCVYGYGKASIEQQTIRNSRDGGAEAQAALIQTRIAAASPLCVSDDGFEALLDAADADCAYVGVFNAQRQLTTPSIFISRRRVKTYPIVLSSIYELLFCSKPAEVRAHSFLVEIEYRGSYWRAALLRAAEKAPFDDGIGRHAEAALRRVAELNRNITSLQNIAKESPHTAPWALAVLDRELRVASAWTSPSANDLLQHVASGAALPIFIDTPLRFALADWEWDDAKRCAPRVFSPVPDCAARVSPMLSRDRLYAVVIIEGLELNNAIEDSMRRFRVSEREREVLALLFQGYRDREIALRLTLALSTVQDHIRHIVTKTQSRTRLEMAARILGWR